MKQYFTDKFLYENLLIHSDIFHRKLYIFIQWHNIQNVLHYIHIRDNSEILTGYHFVILNHAVDSAAYFHHGYLKT